MEEYEILEDDFDDFLEVILRPRKRRRVRPRPDYMHDHDDDEFRTRFRLSKGGVQYVHDMIETQIKTATMRNQALESMSRLLLTLRFYSIGDYLMAAGDFIGVSPASASRIIHEVSKAIAGLRTHFIDFPKDLNNLKRDFFFNIAKFPKVIGAIDCTHVQIINSGGDHAENFRNRKSTFSINVQVVASAQLKILDILARWPGSCHDQTIFNNSIFKSKLITGHFGSSVIVGDSGYENNNHVLTPLLNPTTPAETLYNEAQIRTRNVVERTFGVLKSRFPVLRRVIALSLDRVQAIIVACAVLHNIAIDLKEEDFSTDQLIEVAVELSESHGSSSNHVRNNYISYFETLLNEYV